MLSPACVAPPKRRNSAAEFRLGAVPVRHRMVGAPAALRRSWRPGCRRYRHGRLRAVAVAALARPKGHPRPLGSRSRHSTRAKADRPPQTVGAGRAPPQGRRVGPCGTRGRRDRGFSAVVDGCPDRTMGGEHAIPRMRRFSCPSTDRRHGARSAPVSAAEYFHIQFDDPQPDAATADTCTADLIMATTVAEAPSFSPRRIAATLGSVSTSPSPPTRRCLPPLPRFSKARPAR